jgi:hypothetical protein
MIETLILLPFAVRYNLFVTRWFIVAPVATFHCANHVPYIRTRTREKYASCMLGSLWATLRPACWVSVWELSLTCELPYANTRVIIVWLSVSAEWLTDTFTCGGSLWDTYYMSCRRGVPCGALTCDLSYANTRYNCTTSCEHWLIDWCIHTRSLPLRHKLHVLSTRSTQWNWSQATC